MAQGPCATCGLESKYKCPACETLSCSVHCIKQHKQAKGCTGSIDPTAFVPKPELFTSLGLNRDYNFLQRVGRDISLDKTLLRNHKVFKPRDQWRAGVKVRTMARGMSRVKANRSRWNKTSQEFEWTVEILRQGLPRTFAQVGERTLVQALPERFSCPSSYDVVHRDADGQRAVLAKAATLAEALKGRSVLEFPCIELIEKGTFGENGSSASDSSDSSGSDSSDSDSSDSDSSDSESSAEDTGEKKSPTNIKGAIEGTAAESEITISEDRCVFQTEVPSDLTNPASAEVAIEPSSGASNDLQPSPLLDAPKQAMSIEASESDIEPPEEESAKLC